MRLSDPPLLLITDRQQALLPLADVVRAALATGCRWVSMREKDLSEIDQVALARTLLSIARHHGACLTLHGNPYFRLKLVPSKLRSKGRKRKKRPPGFPQRPVVRPSAG